MKITDRIRKLFLRRKIEENKLLEKEIESATIIDEKDMYAYYLKESKKYVLVKDSQFPYWLSKEGIEWIEMNKHNFDYYGEFKNFSLMFEKIQKLHEQEIREKKTEDDYLKDYLEHCTRDYSKIIDKMKLFEIDGEQYNQLIEKIKIEIEWEINNTLKNYNNMNRDLDSKRTYNELINSLVEEETFKNMYPYYKDIDYEDSISHCGYPDYMWQSGAERNLYRIR